MHPFQVEFDGLRLRGWRRPGDGPRVLAVHGWLDNANTYLPLADYLPGVDLLSVDLPGHGRSDHLPHPGTYHFIDTVYWLVKLLEHWGPAHLIGHSLGGGLSSIAGAVVPELTRGIILLDALGPITSPEAEAPQLFRRSLEAEKKTFQRRYYPTYEEAMQRLQHPVLAERSLMSDAHGFYFSYDPRVRAISRIRISEPQIRAYLQALQCKVQVQIYSQGILNQFPLQDRLQCLQHGQLVELQGGHHLHLDQPELVAAHVRGALYG
ncbi:hypothetical protein ABS71_17250 [bacterium SCN 62-11]|mgnify:CR=1 FL=1|nr:alpha/beta fold hydrolase [Candidatus Eremiobacteraeota bacterium]ODT60596.1 MAG: hypothetical protein ABS71_17250 [bacterium SCN 62-11]